MSPGTCPQCSLAWPEGAKRCNNCKFSWGDKTEIWAGGIDESLLGVGGDPWRGNVSSGLRVPTASTVSLLPAGHPVSEIQDLRYLFMLASFILGEEEDAVILGYRMFWELGVKLPLGNNLFRVIRQRVTDPGFMLPDGNVSWHMTVLRGVTTKDAINKDVAIPVGFPQNVPGVSFRLSSQSALLCESLTLPANDKLYVDLTGYVPPMKGRPFGEPMIDGFETFHGLRTEEDTHGAWHALRVPVKGPGIFGFYASVRQTAGDITIPDNLFATPFLQNGLSDEEQFIADWNTPEHPVKIWRVGGALAVET